MEIRSILFGLMLWTPNLLLAQTAIPFVINGKIGQLTAPAKVYLVRGPIVLDSADLQSGAFSFRGMTDIPKEVELVLQRDGKLRDAFSGSSDRTRVYLEQTPVTLTSTDSLTKSTIKGGVVTQEYQQLQASLNHLLTKQKAIIAKYKEAGNSQQQSAEFQENMNNLENSLSKEYADKYIEFIKKNPSSWISLELLLRLRMFGVTQYDVVAPLYEALDLVLKNSPPGREYGEIVHSLQDVRVGAQAPLFTQKTPNGKTVSITSYRNKYVLIDFWASWCAPCRAESSNLVKIYNEYKDRNFDIISVSLDNKESRAKWVKAIADDHLPWTQVSDLRGEHNEAARRYHVQSIPQNFLLDPNGKIVAVNLKGNELREALVKYIPQ